MERKILKKPFCVCFFQKAPCRTPVLAGVFIFFYPDHKSSQNILYLCSKQTHQTMELKLAFQLARQLMNENGLHNWKLEPTRAKRSFGICKYRAKMIGLSSYLIPQCTEKATRNTITHEIAHAIVGHGHGHDMVWRRQHLELGGDGNRCNGDENYIDGAGSRDMIHEKHFNYVAVCPNGHKHYRDRYPKNRMSCGQCSRRFDPNNILHFTPNV